MVQVTDVIFKVRGVMLLQTLAQPLPKVDVKQLGKATPYIETIKRAVMREFKGGHYDTSEQ